MSKQTASAFATVTFALYNQAPIACQGDDDLKKIRVLMNSLPISRDIHEDALRRAVALGEAHGCYVQVWDIQLNG